MSRNRLWQIVLALALLLGSLGGPATAQLQTGTLFGTVSGPDGAPIPAVRVTLSGSGAPQAQVADDRGKFRFPGLPPGSYTVEAQPDGFTPVRYPNVIVSVGRNTEIELTLTPTPNFTEVVTITTEPPLLDTRRISTGNAVSQTELEKIPTTRDPWAILQSTPGVLVDRVNVGGNESGQQSQYVGPGSSGAQAVWSLDGVVITDMSATGSSPGYFDFDAFEEMQVTTGGSDATIATGGVVLNMVTRRGTNEWRGSGRYYVSDQDLQSDLEFDENRARPGRALEPRHRADRVQAGQPDRRGPGLWRRGRWSDCPRPALVLGLLCQAGDRPPDHQRFQRQDHSRKLERQDHRADLIAQLGHFVRLGQRQGEDRP